MPSIFWIFILIACVLLFLTHFAVYKGLLAIFSINSPAAILGLKIFLITFGLSFVAATFLSGQYNNALTRLFYTLSASWLGLLFYLFLAVSVYALLNLVFGAYAPGLVSALGKMLVFLALLVSAYGLWNAEQIRITRYQISLPNLPESWQGRRAILVSDLHLGQIHGSRYAQKVAQAINQENPDIIFIPGDLYDGVKVDENAIITPLRNLRPGLGVYFVTGNHEEFGDSSPFLEAVTSVGIKALDNEMVSVEGVNIVGVGDRDSIQREVFEEILAGLQMERGTPTILLKHQPAQLDIAEKYGVSLQVSGHTHRAQMWPLSYIPRLIYKGYDYGLKSYGEMQVITSDGVGTWGPPLRVGTNSEIVVLEFK